MSAIASRMKFNADIVIPCRRIFADFENITTEWAFHLYSVWLFTSSDLKTIVIPSTAFGLLNGIAVSLCDLNTLSFQPNLHLPPPAQILRRTPMILLWTWINLLPFAINNQRQPDAIQEDMLNKPWRPLPSQRLSPQTAKRIMLALFFAAIVTSLFLGNLFQCLALVLLGHLYNDRRGGDVSCLARNLINACGFVCFFSGAMQVAIGGRRGVEGQRAESALQLPGWWYLVIACIVFSTVQTQDMYDQRGDAVRNRKTVPLVIGDGRARWTIAVPMALWCWVTPWLWASSPLAYMAPVFLGVAVAARTLRLRSEEEDKTTFRLWNLWLMSIYLLPLLKAWGLTNFKQQAP